MRGLGDSAVVYDVSDDRERYFVDRILRGFGFRIQQSVFECRLNGRGKDELIRRLEQIGLKSGFVKLYRLEYASRNRCIGAVPPNSFDAGSAYIV